MTDFAPPDRAPIVRRIVLAAALLAGGRGMPAARAQDEPALRPGETNPAVVCRDDQTQTYAAFLPSAYSPDREWPILYCFDPAARGGRPVERFRRAAEQRGWIVVGSNNAQNGSWSEIAQAARALLADTGQRFRIDPQQRYAAGFSGGARAACALALQGELAGVIACSGGFPDSVVPAQIGFAVFATTGREDFNFLELHDVAAQLNGQAAPCRLAVFDGGHEWLPEPLTGEALDWLQLRSMQSHRRPVEPAWVAHQVDERRRRIAALPPADAWREWRDLSVDFAGLTDTGNATQTAAALQETKAVQSALAAERKAAQQEQKWTAELYAAIGLAQHPPPRRVRSATGGQIPSGYGRDAARSADSSGGFGSDAPSAPAPWPESSVDGSEDEDLFRPLRSAVNDIHRKAKKNLAAKRALNRAYAIRERAHWAAAGGDFTAARVYLEAATIIRPEAPEAYFEWAQICAQQDDRRRGRELLREATARGFKDAAALATLEAALC